MPEGPEVRKYADALDEVLRGRVVTLLEARTKNAREWLKENDNRVLGRRVERVISHGKHLIGYIENGCFFHSHLMMWGRWQTFRPTGTRKSKTLALPEKERRERARIVVEGGAAILLSAPIFNVGEGDPYDVIEHLATLGPDAIPYDRLFDSREFRRRLFLSEHLDLEIGAALLNQRIVAGLGNYLRAEVLFSCKLNPWQRISELKERQLKCLVEPSPDWLDSRINTARLQVNQNGSACKLILLLSIKWVGSMALGTWFFVVLTYRAYVAEITSGN